MDSIDESTSKENRMKLKCDGDKCKNCKSTLNMSLRLSDNVDLFTPNQACSSSVSTNGPRAGHINSLVTTEGGQFSTIFNENIAECYNNVSASHYQSSSKASCSHSEDKDKCGSRTDTSTVIGPLNDTQTCQRHKVCMDISGNGYNLNSPSTSGTSRICDWLSDCGAKESRKRPSSLKLNRPNLDADDSSDTANDDYSLGSEDGCIYTYRGGEHLADLPSSFFSLDMGLPLDRHLPVPLNYAPPQQAVPNAREGGSRASSPDMDFLEMDFDPGPSCEVDSGDDSTPEDNLEADNMPEENEPVLTISPDHGDEKPLYPTLSEHPPKIVPNNVSLHDMPSTSRGAVLMQETIVEPPIKCHSYGPYITHTNFKGEKLLVRRTMSQRCSESLAGVHIGSGILVSPKDLSSKDVLLEDAVNSPVKEVIPNHNEGHPIDSVNLTSVLYHLSMARHLLMEETVETIDKAFTSGQEPVQRAGDANAGCSSKQEPAVVEVPRCMIWSEREACERQVTQIGTSACGATAVVNVFLALNIPVNIQRINSAVGTRQRANDAPIPRYLLSRAVAGCTAADIVNGLQTASDGLVSARFFPMFPERAMSLSHWLADWISIGAVPIVTLNLQVACDGVTPDAWHHQMVFGVSPRGVYLCNPLECVRESALWPRLTSPSVLLVSAADVVSRFTPTTDLTPLMHVPDARFHTFNVLGQVVNIIREYRSKEGSGRVQFVRIPASYRSGVTLAALTGSEAHRRLQRAPNPPPVADPPQNVR